MNLIVILIMWFILTIVLLVQMGYYVYTSGGILLSNVTVFIFIWFALSLIFIAILIYKNNARKKFQKILEYRMNNESFFEDNYKEGEFFYQSPLILLHSQYIPIYGIKKVNFKIYFENIFQKWLSILDIFPIFNLKVETSENIISIKRIKPFALRYHYEVYKNEKKIGILEQRKFFTKKRTKGLVAYEFNSNDNTYSIDNTKFTTKTFITDKNNNIIMEAKRSLFDMKKGEKFNVRGEKHSIEILSSVISDELLLALYVQVMLDKQYRN